MHEGGRKAVAAALLANLGIAIAKFIGFAITRSPSMMAEGIHSVADTGNQFLLLLGGHKAKKPPDEQHPFGHGRERFFWAFVVSMVLFSLGSLFALVEGYEKLMHPHELESAGIAIAILGVAIVLESFSLRTAYKESKPLKGDQSWWSFIHSTKNPELATVLLEDVGALTGLVFAISGVAVAEITGDARFDAVGSIAIGLLLGVIAFVLARENKSLLIGEAASKERVAEITKAIEGDESATLVHLKTLHLGPEELLVAAKVWFGRATTPAQVAAEVNAAEGRIRSAIPEARLIFLEPGTETAPA